MFTTQLALCKLHFLFILTRKFKEVKSGNLAGHARGLQRPIHFCG